MDIGIKTTKALARQSKGNGGPNKKEKHISRSVKDGLQFPAGRLGHYLKKGKYAKRVGTSAPVYLAATLEYLVAEVLELDGNTSRENKKNRITPRHVLLAVRIDEDHAKLFAGVTIPQGGVIPYINPVLLLKKSKKTTEELESSSTATKSLEKA